MTFNPPSELQLVTSVGWGTLGRKYVRTQSTSNSAQYYLSDSAGVEVGSNQNDVKFTNTNGQLSIDVQPTDGADAPNSYKLNGAGSYITSGNVSSGSDLYFYDGGSPPTLKARLIVSDFYGSSGSGPGTSTEGSSAPSGSSYVNSNGQIVFVINGTSPSSDSTVVYKIFRRPVGGIFEQAYVVTHTSGTSPADDTEYNVGSGTGYSRWELRVESSTGLVSSGLLAFYIDSKKVFCNFW